ncbi:hypothetical protein FHG87_013022 [Trinorchestia longiramus]|nr:hypothetical protein FHG87_013022 [Trinorchestia longiramus]
MAVPGREQDDYWGDSFTATSDLDDFFDENSTTSWKGSGDSGAPLADWSRRVKPAKLKSVNHPVEPRCHDSSDGSLRDSILDNITTNLSGPETNLSSVGLSRGVGRSLGSLGEKLHDWKPPSVKKWSNAGGAVDRCSNCSTLEQEVALLSNQLQASFSRSNVALAVPATVHAMCTGQPYSLHCYRSLQEKQELVAAALRAAHTQTLVAVLVFCRNTLSRQLFMQELERSPVAAQSYVCFLKQRRQYSDAVEVLQALGRQEEAALLRYRQCLSISDHAKKVSALSSLTSSSLTSPHLAHYRTIINDHVDLLERQKIIDDQDAKNTSSPLFVEYPRASRVYGTPLLTTLYYCSMYHWNDGRGTATAACPSSFRQTYRLTDRQYLWAVVRGRARVKHFYLPEQLPSLLSTRSGGMLGSLSGALSAVSSSLAGSTRPLLPPDRLLDALASAAAPAAVLAAYLAQVEPKELRLRLAQHYDVTTAVVEVLVALKDRAALQQYMDTRLPPGSADYLKADAALKSGRWK